MIQLRPMNGLLRAVIHQVRVFGAELIHSGHFFNPFFGIQLSVLSGVSWNQGSPPRPGPGAPKCPHDPQVVHPQKAPAPRGGPLGTGSPSLVTVDGLWVDPLLARAGGSRGALLLP